MARPALMVFCDFDGTITVRDTVNALLDALADPSWTAIESEWERGRIGSRECLTRQIPLIRGGWPAMERVLESVAFDPSFAGFAAWCASRAIPLIVVSDGLDRVIEWLLARERIQVDAVWANRLVIDANGASTITFPHPPRERDCRSGLCKCQALLTSLAPAGSAGRVVIGDGLSDLCWASKADYCFAKGPFLAACRDQRIPCFAFESFTAIQGALSDLAEGRASAASLAHSRG